MTLAIAVNDGKRHWEKCKSRATLQLPAPIDGVEQAKGFLSPVLLSTEWYYLTALLAQPITSSRNAAFRLVRRNIVLQNIPVLNDFAIFYTKEIKSNDTWRIFVGLE